jgi:hypothetical protein
MSTENPPEKTNSDTVRISIHQGRTFKTGEIESLRVDYTIQSEEPRSSLAQSVEKWDEYLDLLISRKAKKISSTKVGTTVHHRKLPPTPEGIDFYSGLPWVRSKNHPNLQTIRVTKDMSPVAESLYMTLTKSENKTLRLKDVTYKLSITQDGAEFLQRWSQPPDGTASPPMSVHAPSSTTQEVA